MRVSRSPISLRCYLQGEDSWEYSLFLLSFHRFSVSSQYSSLSPLGKILIVRIEQLGLQGLQILTPSIPILLPSPADRNSPLPLSTVDSALDRNRRILYKVPYLDKTSIRFGLATVLLSQTLATWPKPKSTSIAILPFRERETLNLMRELDTALCIAKAPLLPPLESRMGNRPDDEKRRERNIRWHVPDGKLQSASRPLSG